MSVKLRYPELRDAAWMLKEERSPEAKANSDFDDDYSLEDIKNFIDLNRTGADPSQVRLIIEVDGSAAGMVDITGISKRNGHADIGVYVAKEYRHKGVATEALRNAVQVAALMGISHLKALISTVNPHSMKLFEKVGFEKIGELPGWLNHGKHNGVVYYLSIMGEDMMDVKPEEAFEKDAMAASDDEFSLYGLNDEDSYRSPFDDPDGYGDGFDDGGDFGGFESIDDYIDKI